MRSISFAVFGVLLSTTSFAFSAQLGDSGTFAIGVDRIFGYVSYTESYERTTTVGTTVTRNKYESTISNFSLLGRVLSVNVAQVPRLSFDAFVGPGISIGGSLMYDHYSTSHKVGGTEDPDKTSTGLWLFSPRIGFAYMFTPEIGIWPRAGIMYVHTSSDSPSTDTTTGRVTNYSESAGTLFYTMDVNLVLTPLPHVGFTVGPTLDYLLSSSQSSSPPETNPQSNKKEHALGLQAGLLGWF